MDSDHCNNKVCSTSSTGSDQSDNKVCLTSSTDSRIVNLGQLNNYLNKIAVHAATCEAYQNRIGSSPNEMTLIMEEARYGMASILAYQCCGCGNQISFASSTKVTSPKGNKYWTCNLAAVWGQMATGGGYSKLEESMSILGVPVMSKKLFISTEKLIGKWWWNLLEESMCAAGKMERELAIQRGSFHQGVPAITVLVDAGWSKRTHKHTYNALSGVGVIFGQQTEKLLYLGVCNKFCASCKRGTEHNHTCFKNWQESSSSMEKHIILTGFKVAKKQHGVRYMKFIGDGDSSVYPSLVAGVPGWGYAINKQECANHALKCYRASLEQLVKDKPQYKGKHKLTAAMRQRLTKAARCAVIMRSKEADRRKGASLLQDDIINGPMHCFGSHHKCRPEYCKTVRSRCNTTSNSVNSPSDTTLSINVTSSPNLNISPHSSNSTYLSPDISSAPSGSSPPVGSLTPNNLSSTLTLAASSGNSNNFTATDKDVDDNDSEVEPECIEEFLEQQQQAWEDATNCTEDTEGYLDPTHPIDESMICDIKAIASRLASKAQQLLGKHYICIMF